MKRYSVQRQMAIFFGVIQPQICRICNYYRKFIEISLALKNEIEEGDVIHIVDAAEQLIERPKDNEFQK